MIAKGCWRKAMILTPLRSGQIIFLSGLSRWVFHADMHPIFLSVMMHLGAIDFGIWGFKPARSLVFGAIVTAILDRDYDAGQIAPLRMI